MATVVITSETLACSELLPCGELGLNLTEAEASPYFWTLTTLANGTVVAKRVQRGQMVELLADSDSAALTRINAYEDHLTSMGQQVVGPGRSPGVDVGSNRRALLNF